MATGVIMATRLRAQSLPRTDRVRGAPYARASEATENRIRQCGVLSAECVGWHGPGGTVLLETRTEHSPAGAVAPAGSRLRQGGQAGPFAFWRIQRVRTARGAKWASRCCQRTYGFRLGSETFRFVLELSETFRFVPFRSETFRFVPFRSAWFRAVPKRCPRCLGRFAGRQRFAGAVWVAGGLGLSIMEYSTTFAATSLAEVGM